MRKGVFGFDIWFYGVLAMLLAVCQQPLVLGGLLAFVFLIEKDDWLNRQLMQGLLLCLGLMVFERLVDMLFITLAFLPFLALFTVPAAKGINMLFQLFCIVFALRACDRMHKGLDSDLPFISGFVNSMF